MVSYELEDGKYVPPGSHIGVDVKAIHFDPEIYPDPYRCHLFRFVELRAGDPSDSKHSFSALDATVSPLHFLR